MGIPGLNSWFKRTFADAYVDLSTVKIDHLYVDMNSVLHLVLRNARTMHQFYVLLFDKCDFIMRCCRPRKSVMFALDGPAPLAKLLTQRTRRKKVTLTASDSKGKTVSPLALTPGTPFMQEVHEALAYFICQRLIGTKWSHLRMELSGSTVQGEGECKILARLQRPMNHVAKTDTHALIGNDSDLLMMSLMAGAEHVYVLGQILNHPSELPSSLGKLKVFSVERLTKPLMSLFPSLKGSPDAMKNFMREIQRDLAITCILGRGNDYLPSVGGTSIEKAHEVYDPKKRTAVCLPQLFQKAMHAVVIVGEYGLWSVYTRLRNEAAYTRRSLVKRVNGRNELDYEILHRLFQEAGIKEISRKLLESQKKPDPFLYLDGIKWMLDTYSAGICPDYRFVYDAAGPSSQELCDAILKRRQSPGSERVMDKECRLPLRPSECALALLPYHAQRYIPKPLQHLMEPSSPIGDLFEECKECAQLSQTSSELNASLGSYMERTSELKKRIEKLQTEPSMTLKLQAKLQKLESKAEAVRQQIRETSVKREAHANEKHPYEPFPIGRIEEAVKNVPVSKFQQKDLELFSFGQEYVFQRMSRSARSNCRSAQLIPIRKDAPEPPSEKFRKFKTPLPILRGKYPHDRLGMKSAQAARGVLTVARHLLHC